jgi:hypothetical protein
MVVAVAKSREVTLVTVVIGLGTRRYAAVGPEADGPERPWPWALIQRAGVVPVWW